MPLLPSQRHLFDIPDNIAYFNCASSSPQLKASLNRLQASVRGKNHPWERTTQSFFDDAETIRRLSAEIFGGDFRRECGWLCGGACRELRHEHGGARGGAAPAFGDRILVIADEFPSVVPPWRRTAQETGAVLITVPTPDRRQLDAGDPGPH